MSFPMFRGRVLTIIALVLAIALPVSPLIGYAGAVCPGGNECPQVATLEPVIVSTEADVFGNITVRLRSQVFTLGDGNETITNITSVWRCVGDVPSAAWYFNTTDYDAEVFVVGVWSSEVSIEPERECLANTIIRNDEGDEYFLSAEENPVIRFLTPAIGAEIPISESPLTTIFQGWADIVQIPISVFIAGLGLLIFLLAVLLLAFFDVPPMATLFILIIVSVFNTFTYFWPEVTILFILGLSALMVVLAWTGGRSD